jgi:tRNA(fMet)-specific endonuclease VapC
MMQFILDTDHVSLILRGDVRLKELVSQTGIKVCTTVITVQELFNGWMLRINNASPSDDFVELYTQLCRTVEYVQTTQILNFDGDADACFRKLLQNHPSLRKSRLQRDMRIAAIALSLEATVVTRNLRDFEQVPGLTIADWTVAC